MAQNPTRIIAELNLLVQEQIELLERETAISQGELHDYRERSERIRALYRELEESKSREWLDGNAACSSFRCGTPQ